MKPHLNPIYRTEYSEEYGRVVHVRREGGPAWVVGMSCIIKGRLGIWRNLRGRARRYYRSTERLPRDLTGVIGHPQIRTPHAQRIIAQRHAAGRVARRSRASQHALAAQKRRARQRKHRLLRA